MSIVNAFTCTGAYAVLIMSGLKRVENRSMMPDPARGRCAMSVSKKFCRQEYENLVAWLAGHCNPAVSERLLGWDEVKMWPRLSVAGVKKNIRKLKDANLVRRVGPDKGGHWEVVG